MCNLYSFVTTVEAIRRFVRAFEIAERLGNFAPYPGIFPDYAAPILRNGPEGVLLTTARWGMPSPRALLDKSAAGRAEKLEAKGKPFDIVELRRLEPDPGVTNIRNLTSPHWRRWLAPENRCVVPVTSFAEPELQSDGSRPPVWFARDVSRPLMFFAGIHVRGWTSVHKIKLGIETDDLFGFLTCAPNSEVAAVHEKAMPVLLTTAEEVHIWLTAPIEEALKLQRPLPNGALKIVARGERRGDPPELAAQMAS